MAGGEPSILVKKYLCCLRVLVGSSLLLVFFCSPLTLCGQNTSHSDKQAAERLLDHALALQDSAKYEYSNNLFKKSASLFLQVNAPFKAAHCYNHISSNLRLMDQSDPAEQAAHKALGVITGRSSGNNTEYIRAYTNLGLIYAGRAYYKQAQKWLTEAHKLLDSPSVSPYLKTTVTGSLGYLYDDMGKYEEALDYYRKAIQILQQMDHPSQGRLAKLYNNIGYTLTNKGFYEQARNYYKNELKINLRLKGKSHPEVAGAYINIGSSYYRTGDYGEAIIYFKKSLLSALAIYGINHSMVALDYENIGMCYLGYGDYDQAIKNLDKALKIKENILGSSHPDVALTFKNMATVYACKKHYAKALNYAIQALKIQKKVLGTTHPKLVDSYNKIANYLAELNDPDRAFQYLNIARSIALRSLGADHPLLAQTYAALGKVAEIKDHHSFAIAYYQQALRILSDNLLSDHPEDNPAANAYIYPTLAMDILSDKAESLQRMSMKTGKAQYLEAALSTYHVLSDLMDRLQTKYIDKESKQVIGERGHDIYEQAIRTCYRLYRQKNDRDYLEQVFFFMEKSKARIMLESVFKDDARHFAHIPDSLLKKERMLNMRTSSIQRKIDNLISGNRAKNRQVAFLQDSLIALGRTHMDFIQMLEKKYPKYHRLKYANMIPSVATIQQKLQQQDASLVEFMTGRETLFAFVITGNDIYLRKLTFDARLEQHIKTFNNAISNRNKAFYLKWGHHIFNTLWASIEPGLKPLHHIFIVPDGILALLPFEALLTHPVPTSNTDYHDLPYLLWNHRFSYLPSIALSNALQARNNRLYKVDFLAFAPVFSTGLPTLRGRDISINGKETWNPLPFSRTEVEQVDSLFNRSSGLWRFLFDGNKTQLYLNEDASESMLKSSAPLSSRYIHFATHSFIDKSLTDNQKRESGIVLYPGKDSHEDGILYTREIYNLSINTDLVALSACETGIGSVVKGEGIMSLSRAFQYAGAENMLVSLWKVADRASARLMVEFYRNQMETDNKSRSLQKAKERLINSTEFAHPFYWAPFILIGN